MTTRRQVPYSLLVHLTQALGRASLAGHRVLTVGLRSEELAALKLLVEQEKARQQEEAEPGFGLGE
jgi:hypothetical protein